MLVLSRHRDEVIEVSPGPTFATAVAALLPAVAPFSPEDVWRIEAALKLLLEHKMFKMAFTVVDIRGDKVRVGCHAEAAWAIHRLEVAEAIRREAKTSGGSAA